MADFHHLLFVVLLAPCYYWLLVVRPRETPLDTDSANHFRLAQLWKSGVCPAHPYRPGVKWLPPRFAFLLYFFFKDNPHRFRTLSVLQFSIGHLLLGLFPPDLDVDLWWHAGLFFLNLSALIFPLTTSFDPGSTLLVWTLVMRVSTSPNPLLFFVLGVVLILALGFFWKMSELIYLVPLAGALSLRFGFDTFEATATVGGLVISGLLFGLLAKFGLRVDGLSQVTAYRRTRTILRRKVLWPLGILLFFWAIFLVLGLGLPPTIPGWMWWLTAAGFIRNFVSGDFATGVGAYHLFFPLFALSLAAGSHSSLSFILTMGPIAVIPFFFPSQRIGDAMRRISSGGTYPSRRNRLDEIERWFVKVGGVSTNTLLLGTDTPLAVRLELAGLDGVSYSSIHSEYWSTRRLSLKEAQEEGFAVLVSKPLPMDLEQMSESDGFRRISGPTPGVALLTPNKN